MSMTLEYNYAIIDVNTGRCRAVYTASNYVDNQAYIIIPYTTNDYYNKYYNLNGDQMWYHDPEFTQLWEECPSHNV